MMNKSKLVLGLATASLTIAAATLAPQAQAHQKAKNIRIHTIMRCQRPLTAAVRLLSVWLKRPTTKLKP